MVGFSFGFPLEPKCVPVPGISHFQFHQQASFAAQELTNGQDMIPMIPEPKRALHDLAHSELLCVDRYFGQDMGTKVPMKTPTEGGFSGFGGQALTICGFP